jgi:hypothetical protein
MNREAIPLDASLLPSAAAIFPHLQPSLAVVRRTAAGVEITSRGPLAGMNAGPLLPLSFMFLGLARSAPGPLLPMSSRGASTNNLKQIALAVLNYAEDAEAINTLPPAFIADKASGKALLSWRVAVLPYIEQDALYKEFLLDEPWDSPHNKPLIARMPATFRSPSGAAQPGKTRYVTLRDKDSAFPGKEAVRFADITDGTSNTIMAVEADEAHAVIWTKPDDLEFNPKKPATGLTGQPAHGFLAACCDGSVHFISDTIDREVLRDLVNRHDGNAVSVP